MKDISDNYKNLLKSDRWRPNLLTLVYHLDNKSQRFFVTNIIKESLIEIVNPNNFAKRFKFSLNNSILSILITLYILILSFNPVLTIIIFISSMWFCGFCFTDMLETQWINLIDKPKHEVSKDQKSNFNLLYHAVNYILGENRNKLKVHPVFGTIPDDVKFDKRNEMLDSFLNHRFFEIISSKEKSSVFSIGKQLKVQSY